MVTFHYFFNYFVLLVLQSSVFLYAQEPLVPPASSLPESLPALSPATDKKSELTSNETLPQINSTPTQISDVNITNTNDAKANNSVDKHFPESSQDGRPVLYLKKTQETPPINLKPTNPKIDTELGDLNSNNVQITHQISDKPPNVTSDIKFDNEVVLIEDGENTEDILRSPSQQETGTPAVPLVQGQLAAILAAVFVVISVVAYFGLLSWRRYLENRYGNRQMLVNEDELNNTDDMRYFTI